MALWIWWLALFKIELFSHFNNLRAIGIQPIQSGIWEPVVRYSLKFERWSIIGNLRCHGLLIFVWDKLCYIHNSSTIHKKLYTRNICVTRTCLTLVLCLKCIHYVFSIMHECAVEPWTRVVAYIEFIVHCYLSRSTGWSNYVTFVTCTQIGTLCECPCCSAVVCHQFITSKLVDRHLPNSTGPLSANKPLPAFRQPNLDDFLVKKWDASAKTQAGGWQSRLTAKQQTHIDAPITT